VSRTAGMSFPLAILVDVVSALAALVLAGAFVALWRRSRAPLHILFATAFATLAVGMSVVSTSEFDLSGSHPAIDALRVVAHTAAPLMLVLGYRAAWRDLEARPARTALVSLGLSGGLAALLFFAPPSGAISAGTTSAGFAVAHALQFLLYLALVTLSARTFFRAPSWRRALVPLAFLAYSFSKYSWILIDLSEDRSLVALVYFWRFVTLALFLAALLIPLVKGVRHAEA